MKSLVLQLKNNENPTIVDEGIITLKDLKGLLKEVLEPYMRESSTEPTYFFNYEQYKAYNEAMEAEIKPYIKIKDPSLPRGNNFTPKKKKRK